MFYSTGQETDGVINNLIKYFKFGFKTFFPLSFSSGPHCNKTITVVIYECPYKVRVFVPGRPFQPGLMFVGKAYLRVEHTTLHYLLNLQM